MTTWTGRLAFDLLDTDLDDPDSLAALVVRHGVDPARAVFGFGAMQKHQSPEWFLRGRLSLNLGSLAPMWPDAPSAAVVEPLLRGLALVTQVFPRGLRREYPSGWTVDRPGLDLPSHAFGLAAVQHDELRWLAARGIGIPAGDATEGASIDPGWQPDASGISALRAARALVERSLLPPVDELEPVAREEAGFDAVDTAAAAELDEILRAHAPMRLVRITDHEAVLAEEQVPHPDAPDLFEEIIVERGVLPVVLPDSIAGLVAYDFVETFRLGRRTGICEQCRRPFLLESQQASLARRGQPVYHPACFAERRKRYMRDYRAARRHEPEDVNSRSGLSLSTGAA